MEKKSLANLTSSRSRSFGGVCSVPGDKSISHRSLIFGALNLGTTTVRGMLEGEDVISTANALRQMGVTIEKDEATKQWQIQGVGIGGLREPENVLDMGNSGTSTRLLMGLCAPYPYSFFFCGDTSLSKRPMQRVITPLSNIGATFEARQGDRLPLLMKGTQTPLPTHYTLPVASAQVKSALLLAGLNIAGKTSVSEPEPTRDHTERMIEGFGLPIEIDTDEDGHRRITVTGHAEQRPTDREITVPADPSSAAFPIVAALITPGSAITLPNILMNEHRTGLFTTLKEMGANITYVNERDVCGERVADIEVRHSQLKAITVPAERAPSMIDEYPILSIAAAFAEGEMRMDGLAELRVKESNRLAAMVDGLKACGVDAREEGDSCIIQGMAGEAPKGDATIAAHHDHRIAMSFLVLGMQAQNTITIDDASAIATSFPTFIELMNSLGAEIHTEQSRAEATAVKALPPMVIAIDGPAASGKGTLGRRLAQSLGLSYLDTGSLYRAVGLKVLDNNDDPHDEEAAIRAAYDLRDSDMTDFRIRQEGVGKAASIVSAIPKVREILLDYQRDYAKQAGGAILDGRDIGTVVCPQADIKLFITANADTRAHRRVDQLHSQKMEADFETIKEDIIRRDKRDSERATAPLKAAHDATSIDTSDMTADEVFEKVIGVIEKRFK